MFHTIVSIKNDGHYFCRAGGNRPDGLNEPVTSNRIDRRSQRGAGDPYTGEVVGCETNESGISAAYGTTKIYTTDTRARWLHGGGSSLRDPYAPRQGWKPTMGCTRAQNEDVDELCKKVTSWMYSHPGERIRYERFKTR